jgi:hypothetical protein
MTDDGSLRIQHIPLGLIVAYKKLLHAKMALALQFGPYSILS